MHERDRGADKTNKSRRCTLCSLKDPKSLKKNHRSKRKERNELMRARVSAGIGQRRNVGIGQGKDVAQSPFFFFLGQEPIRGSLLWRNRLFQSMTFSGQGALLFDVDLLFNCFICWDGSGEHALSGSRSAWQHQGQPTADTREQRRYVSIIVDPSSRGVPSSRAADRTDKV